MNIPLPDPFSTSLMKGLTLGGSLSDNIVKNQLEQSRNAETHANNQELRKQSQLNHLLDIQKYHSDLSNQAKELAIRAQAARDAHEKITREMDPNFKAQQFQALSQALNGIGNTDQNVITQQANGQNLSYSPMNQGSAQVSPPSREQIKSAFTPEMAKRIAIKEAFGIDPGESNEEKLKLVEDEARARSKAVQESSGALMPTKTITSQNQKVIQSAQNLMPTLDSLIKGEHAYGRSDFWPIAANKKADYDATTGKIIDQLVSVFNLPSTDKSTNLVETLVRRHPYESYDAYLERLKGLKADILDRAENAKNNLVNRTVDTNGIDTSEGSNPEDEDASSRTNEELLKIVAGE